MVGSRYLIREERESNRIRPLLIRGTLLKHCHNEGHKESCSEMSRKDTWVLEDNYSKYAGIKLKGVFLREHHLSYLFDQEVEDLCNKDLV